jgi:hypothetical protein
MKKGMEKSGLMLAEVVMALALLAMASMILGKIMSSSVSTTALSKNYLIAQNLVTEGFEAVKNIRDTNWMLNPDKPECWLTKKPGDSCEPLVSSDLGKGWVVRVNPGHDTWTLQNGGNFALDLSKTTPSAYNTSNGKYLLQTTGIGNLSKIYSVDSSAGGTVPYDSIYYRSIKFITIGPTIVDQRYAVIEVKLQWMEGKNVRTITRNEVIYNYQ